MKKMRNSNLKITSLFLLIALSSYAVLFQSVAVENNHSNDLDKIENFDIPTSSMAYYESIPGGYCQGIEVQGDIAYLACGGNDMAVVNISNPINPLAPVFSSFLGWAYDLDVCGDYAYVAAGNGGLRIIDISTPLGPSYTSTYRDTSGNARDVHVDGNYAYVADGSSGLAVIDITTPMAPGATVYYEDTTGTARAVFVRGDYAYIADYGSGFAVIDISDPTNPGTPITEPTNGDALGVYVEGDYAYVSTSNGLNVINVTDPTNPGYLTMISAGYCSEVSVDGNYAYVAAGIDGLAIINITDPLNPSDLVYQDTAYFTYDVQVSGNWAFCADNSSITVIDISENLITPEVITYVTTTENAVDIDIEGNYAYLACLDAGLAVIDISDPENPGTPVYGTALGGILDVDVVGDYAFCAGFDEGLVIFDVSDPTYPHKVMNQTTIDECRGIDVEGNYAFIACDNAGLAIIDISDPMNPGTAVYKTIGYTTEVEVQGNFAFTTGTYLTATDISDPTSPGTHYIKTGTGPIIDLDVCGNNVFVAAGGAGLNVFDITDPTSIGDAVEEDTIDYSQGVWISGNTAYIADYFDGGLAIMDVTDPRDPGTPSYTPVDTRANKVQVHGDYAYLTVSEHSIQERGLCIVKVRERVDRYDPIISDSPADFEVPLGYTGQSLSWTAVDQHNKTYHIELAGSGTIISDVNWSNGSPVTYNIPDGFTIGTYAYTINFTDSYEHWTTDTVIFTVGLPTTPTATLSPPNATIEVGYSNYNLEWIVLDDNPDSYTLNLVGVGDPIVGPTSWTSGTPITYDLPLGMGLGTYLYVLIALDDDVNYLWDLVEITIEDNFPPVITQYSANMTVEIGYSDLEYTWTATDGDPDTYTIDLVGTGNIVGSTAWTSGTQVIFDIPEGLGEGYHQFMINFTDSSSNYVNHSIWLVVGPDTIDPVFTDLPHDMSVEEGYSSVDFTWTATDANPDTYTIELDGSGIISGPSTFTSGGTITYHVPVGLVPGEYIYTITFTDDYGNSISDSVTLTVTEKPKISFGNTFLVVSGLSIIGLVLITIQKVKKRE